jgi:integrase
MNNRYLHRVPTYRPKTVNGRKYGVVSLPDGKGRRRDVLLGTYGTKESRANYAKTIAEWEAADRCLPSAEKQQDLTVNELIAIFLPHAEQHYRHADGSNTGELHDYKLSLRPLRELYGFTPAAEFGPLALKAIRETLIHKPITRNVKSVDPETGKATWQKKIVRHGLARGVINQRIGRIKRLFKWAVENELVPPSVYQALAAVSGLRHGRSEARETEKVKPVSIALVEDTLPHVLPTVADMIRLLLLTGMRAGELVIMRGCDLDTTGPIWLYRPSHHKTAYRGQGRLVALGPKAQTIVKCYLRPNVEEFLFSPREVMEVYRREQRANRKTPVQPSQQNRRRHCPKRVPGVRYTVMGVANAVKRACRKHGLPHWHLHQLRHTRATEIRRVFGLDAARASLGHTGPAITEHYAELDASKIVEVAAKLG